VPILRLIRRRIALKLTLTLVGFVGLSVLAAGFYLNDALSDFAVESIETRLVGVARLLEADARGVLHDGAGSGAQAFVQRVARATGARVTLIDGDGSVVGESERDAGTVAICMPLRSPLGVTTAPSIRAACVGAGASVTSTSTADSIWGLNWSETGHRLPASERRPLGFGDHRLVEQLDFGRRVSAQLWMREP